MASEFQPHSQSPENLIRGHNVRESIIQREAETKNRLPRFLRKGWTLTYIQDSRLKSQILNKEKKISYII